jgi:hypothetical protein
LRDVKDLNPAPITLQSWTSLPADMRSSGNPQLDALLRQMQNDQRNTDARLEAFQSVMSPFSPCRQIADNDRQGAEIQISGLKNEISVLQEFQGVRISMRSPHPADLL